MIGKKQIANNKRIIRILKDGIGGEFLKLEDYDLNRHQVEERDFIKLCLRLKCPNCGSENLKEPNNIYNCNNCMENFSEPEKEETGFKIDNIELEQFIKGYTLIIKEIPHNFYESGRLDKEKYLIFTRGSEGNFEALDSGAEVTILPLRYLRTFAKEEKEAKEIVEVLKGKRSGRIDFDLITGKEFQSLVYRLFSRLERFDPLMEGGYNQDQGKDGILRLSGHGDQKVMIQAKKKDDVNSDDIRDMVRDAHQHNCEQLVVAILDVTGDAMTKYNENSFLSASHLNNIEIYKEEDIKEMLQQNIDLIKSFGLLPNLSPE